MIPIFSRRRSNPAMRPVPRKESLAVTRVLPAIMRRRLGIHRKRRHIRKKFSFPRMQNIEELHIKSEDGSVIVLSDFHMGEGFLREKRVFARGENFFQDDSFHAFMHYLIRLGETSQKRTTLIINGDFMDFIRVRSLPKKRERSLFARYLRHLGHDLAQRDFTIDAHERSFGLHSHELKSVWKLRRICEGHPLVFSALAEFVLAGNRLILVKGNHDLEFYWPRVQREFLKLLAKKLPPANGNYRWACERMSFIERNVIFCQKTVIIEDAIYIEHGHQYQPITRVAGPPERNGELALPAGSLFNRYLINAIEGMVPFINNIRPTTDIFRAMGWKQKLQFVRVILRNLPITSKMMFRHYQGYGLLLLFELLPHIIAGLYSVFGIALPLLWHAYAQFYFRLTGDTGRFLTENWFLNILLNVAGFLLLRQLSYLLGRNHEFKVHEAYKTAQEKLADGAHSRHPRFLVLSHTHKPEVKNLGNDWWYVNSGTWIPILDRKDLLMHEKLTLTYVQFDKNEKGEWDFQLMQWKDAKDRGERLVLLEG